ncbi:MAG: SWIM zinc finger family protein [Thermoanaerobaculia bacterium]|nr:SWIM zinc finger family protein [Thermoanaerobaculia bacterium]
MNRLTETQVAQLAPDPPSLKAGRQLANKRLWLTLAHNDRVLWGEVQGSGKDPYRTQVDLISLAFRCSCPSRKFPCKHGLGLMFVFADDPAAVKSGAPEPEWVSEWMNRRAANAGKTSAELTAAPAATDEKKAKDKAKRADERLSAAQTGAAELELLLRDLLRGGLLGVPEKGEAYYEKVVRRMIDAKAGGLANWVRNFNKINYLGGNTWHSEVLENAVKAWLLIEAFRRMDAQEIPVQEQIKSLVGWSQSKKDLLENPAAECVTDDWLVLGKKLEALDDNLNMLRVWLYGTQSGRQALLVEYAPAHLPIVAPALPGTLLRAVLAFYPSNLPYRAQIKQQGAVDTQTPSLVEPLDGWEAAHRQAAEWLARSPWADQYPQYVADLTPVTDGHGWFLRDREGLLLAIDPATEIEKIWQLLAVSGGTPLNCFVLRSGNKVAPLGYISTSGQYILI